MGERGEQVAAMVALVALGAWGTWAPRQATPVPPRLPAAGAQVWMADALPGVGAKRREAITEAIRAGRLEDVPASARAAVAEAFTFDR